MTVNYKKNREIYGSYNLISASPKEAKKTQKSPQKKEEAVEKPASGEAICSCHYSLLSCVFCPSPYTICVVWVGPRRGTRLAFLAFWLFQQMLGHIFSFLYATPTTQRRPTLWAVCFESSMECQLGNSLFFPRGRKFPLGETWCYFKPSSHRSKYAKASSSTFVLRVINSDGKCLYRLGKIN